MSTEGIPLRSSLSPFFGALYLSPLDNAFAQMDVFYRRYGDDVIVLIKNKHQYAKARKRLFTVLKSLRLTIFVAKDENGKADNISPVRRFIWGVAKPSKWRKPCEHHNTLVDRSFSVGGCVVVHVP